MGIQTAATGNTSTFKWLDDFKKINPNYKTLVIIDEFDKVGIDLDGNTYGDNNRDGSPISHGQGMSLLAQKTADFNTKPVNILRLSIPSKRGQQEVNDALAEVARVKETLHVPVDAVSMSVGLTATAGSNIDLIHRVRYQNMIPGIGKIPVEALGQFENRDKMFQGLQAILKHPPGDWDDPDEQKALKTIIETGNLFKRLRKDKVTSFVAALNSGPDMINLNGLEADYVVGVKDYNNKPLPESGVGNVSEIGNINIYQHKDQAGQPDGYTLGYGNRNKADFSNPQLRHTDVSSWTRQYQNKPVATYVHHVPESVKQQVYNAPSEDREALIEKLLPDQLYPSSELAELGGSWSIDEIREIELTGQYTNPSHSVFFNSRTLGASKQLVLDINSTHEPGASDNPALTSKIVGCSASTPIAAVNYLSRLK